MLARNNMQKKLPSNPELGRYGIHVHYCARKMKIVNDLVVNS